VRITTHAGDPAVPRGWRRRAILGGLPGVVVGWFAFGPVVTLVFGAVVVALVALVVWSGPRINARLYRSPAISDAVLDVQSAIDRRSGSLQVGPTVIAWHPWKRYEGRVSGFRLNRGDIEAVDIYPRRGIPASCRLEVRGVAAEARSITVYAKASALEAALRGEARDT
jgi:hypothetical protein